MNNSRKHLNWLTITATGLFSTLLLINAAQATDLIINTSNSATSIVDRSSPNLLIAARKKQRIKRKRVRAWRVTAPLSPRHQAIYSLQTFEKIQSMLWSM